MPELNLRDVQNIKYSHILKDIKKNLEHKGITGNEYSDIISIAYILYLADDAGNKDLRMD